LLSCSKTFNHWKSAIPSLLWYHKAIFQSSSPNRPHSPLSFLSVALISWQHGLVYQPTECTLEPWAAYLGAACWWLPRLESPPWGLSLLSGTLHSVPVPLSLPKARTSSWQGFLLLNLFAQPVIELCAEQASEASGIF
jgi:hypothetical protein